MEIASLRKGLARRQSTSSRLAMAPELAYGRHAGPAAHNARQAAVLVLLFPDDQNDWHVLTTIRASAMGIHAGQVCFPGGRLENDETPEAGARREYFEELGPPPADMELVGRLSPIYVFVSNFWVTPCVAVSHTMPQCIPSPDEVASVLTFPWQSLLDAEAIQPMEIQRGGLRFGAPSYRVRDFSIWGATAVMLEELLRVLSAV